MRSRVLSLALACSAASHGVLAGDEGDLAVLRRQIDAMKQEYEQRIRALEARLERAEKAGSGKETAPTSLPPAQIPASALDQAVAEAKTMGKPSHTPASAPAGELWPTGFGGDQMRLIDVSFDILAAGGGSTAPDESLAELQGGGHDPNRNGFTIQQGELSLIGAIDPYFTAESHIIFTDEVVELEEAFFTTTSLPYNLQLEGGFSFTEFGRINPIHPHAWHWLDQPVINTRLFGPDGTRGTGLRLGWLMPTPWFSEIHVGAQDATSETMVSFLGEGEGGGGVGVGGFAVENQETNDPLDLLYLARWVNGFDLSPTWSGQLGLSALHGPNTSGEEGETWIYGTDLVMKWRPEKTYRGWPFFLWETEVMKRDYRVDPLNENFMLGETDDNLNDWGLYSQALYGFSPGWAAGVRFEYASGDGNGEESRFEDPLRTDRYRVSPLLVYHPSEFSRIRLQYNYDNSDHLTEDAHTVWLGVEVLYGKHPAHKY